MVICILFLSPVILLNGVRFELERRSVAESLSISCDISVNSNIGARDQNSGPCRVIKSRDSIFSVRESFAELTLYLEIM